MNVEPISSGVVGLMRDRDSLERPSDVVSLSAKVSVGVGCRPDGLIDSEF